MTSSDCSIQRTASVATNCVFARPRFVDRDDRAAVRAGFGRAAALRRAAVVGDARLLVDRLLQVPAAEGHVVNAVALVAGRIARAVGDADREQAVRIAMKAAGFDLAVFAATRALHAGDRLAGARPGRAISTRPTGNTCTFSGSVTLRGQESGTSTDAARPVNRNAAVAEPRELIEQQHDRRRPGAIDVQHVAGQQHGVGIFGQRRFEHLLGGLVRRFDQQLAQVVRHLGQPVERQLQVQIAGMHQSQRLGHRRLHARSRRTVRDRGSLTRRPAILQLQLAAVAESLA